MIQNSENSDIVEHLSSRARTYIQPNAATH